MQPFVPKMNISDFRFESFLKTHPECNLMPREKVVSIMLEKKYINQKQADYLLGKANIPDMKSYLNPNKYDISEVFDANLSNTKDKQMSYVLKIPKYHKEFKELEVKDNGQIDMAQFDINQIKNKYPSDRYIVNIRSEKAISVWVLDKKTKAQIFALQYFENKPNMFSCRYYLNNNSTKAYTFNNGKISETSLVTRHSYKIKTYNNKGQLSNERISNKNGIVKNLFYDNGYPFIDTVRNINVLAEDLHNDITAKTKLGLPTTRESIDKNILKRITKDNIYTVLSAYKEQYNSDLLDDINGEIGLSKEQREKYIKHIKDSMKKSKETDDKAGRYIAEILARDIYGMGSGDLEQDIYLINKDNIGTVIRNYYNIAKEKHIEARNQLEDIHIPFTDIIIR